MSVYVDNYRGKFGRMIMCHMLADTPEELHAFAQTLGMKREWFQDKSAPHYDLCLSRRAEAIELGAKELKIKSEEWHDVLNRSRRWKAAQHS